MVTELAVDWLTRQQGDRPFFLVVGQKAPHSFYTPEPKYTHAFDAVSIPYPASAFELDDNPPWYKTRLSTWHGIYGPLFDYRKKFPDTRPEAVADFAAMIRGYWGTVLSVDDSVGRLTKLLESRGQLDNTIFVFMGDNGLLNGEHGMVDKRTMHEPSIRIPLIVRSPRLTPPSRPLKPAQQVLTIDLAPSLLELCGAAPLPKAHGQSWVSLIQGKSSAWRTGWLYEYNYEKQFPYTPNIRGIRTDEWKLIRYPHGDGGPDRHQAELFHLKNDPEERKNLINDPAQKERIAQLSKAIDESLKATGADPDRMPLDEGIKQELPDSKSADHVTESPMHTTGSIRELREAVRAARQKGMKIGCVPTMGALHAGHVSLFHACKSVSKFVVATIFVNPTQFAPHEDFSKYPRPLEKDSAAAREAGVDLVFTPDKDTLYPPGYSTYVTVEGISAPLEGAIRPTHFRGVATIVLKLFNLVQPDVAVFGAKDYQQQALIRRMVIDLDVPTEIVTAPTMREADGLAMSSRNVYLSPDQRRSAISLWKASISPRTCSRTAQTDIAAVQQAMLDHLKSKPGVEPDYAVITDPDSLAPLAAPQKRMVALVAARLGSTRLIDNKEITL